MPNEETENLVEFDWLAESLGRFLNRSRKSFTPPFFFNFFAVVDEGWSAIEMGVGAYNVVGSSLKTLCKVINTYYFLRQCLMCPFTIFVCLHVDQL